MCGISSVLWQKGVFVFPPFLISFFFIIFIYLSLHFETMLSSHTIGPSPSRNIGGESERDTQNVSSTPMMRSRTQIVTPAAATTNDHRHHQPWVHIDNRIGGRRGVAHQLKSWQLWVVTLSSLRVSTQNEVNFSVGIKIVIVHQIN